MHQRYSTFLAQSAVALGLTAALAGCGQNGEAQARQREPEAVQQDTGPAAASADAGASPAQLEAVRASPAVATLGALAVSQDELRRFLQALPVAQRDAMSRDRVVLEQWLRSRLAEKAVVEQARMQEWDSKPEIRRAIQEAQNQVILQSYLASVSEPPADYPSEQLLQEAYEANKAQFQMPALYRISQIYLSVPQGDEQVMARARKQAEGLVKQLREGKAQFADLAQAYSDEKVTAERGGDNGFLPLSQLVPAMRAVVEKLGKSQVSDPILQPGGVHILQLTDRQAATVRPFDQVKPALREALRRQRQQEAAQAYVAGMLNTGTVAVDGKVLSATLE